MEHGTVGCSAVHMDTPEELVQVRIDKLEAWLGEQGVDVKREQAHTRGESRERLYWHYGYLIGLRDALKALTLKAPSLPLH